MLERFERELRAVALATRGSQPPAQLRARGELLEAMQHGLPVVTTTVGAIPEVVVDGETGFLVPPDDVTALADRLARLAAQPDLRRQMGAAARHRYRTQFTLEAFERRLVAALARGIRGDDRVGQPVLARDHAFHEA